MLIPREAKYQWGPVKPPHWTENAACVSLPTTMFEIANGGSPIAEGLSEDELKDLNNANFEAAVKVCAGCPVWTECYLSASKEDHQETVRAGITPLRHKFSSRGRPRQAERLIKNDPTKPCKNGHSIEEWRKRTEGVNSWYCQGCKREQKGAQKATRADPNKPCKNDHALEAWFLDTKNCWRCRDCKRARDRERAARKKLEAVKVEG